MNIIAKNRRMGKSWDIVERSIETGYPILCFTSADEMRYRDIARKQGFNPKKLDIIVCDRTNGEFDTGNYDVSQEYLIDDSELFFETLIRKYTNGKIRKIDTIAVDREHIIGENINSEHVDEEKNEQIKENISYLLELYSLQIKDKNCDYGKALNILKNIDMLRGQLNNKLNNKKE